MSRTDDTKDIVEVGQDSPSWLAEFTKDDSSLDEMVGYRVLPRVKIIQSTTDDELKDTYGEGSLLLVPGNVPLCKKDGVFTFVPVFFWVEFLKMSDLKDKESDMFLERTTDPTSELAKLSQDAKTRDFRYGEDNDEGIPRYKGKNVEQLNFACMISGDHSNAGQPMVLSFARGEFTIGRNFINAISMRMVKVPDADGNLVPTRCPLWSTQWEADINRRDMAADRKWWGIDVVPAASPFIDPKDAAFYKAAHEELKELHEKKKLSVSMEDSEDADELKTKATSDF